jgi:hypothetical protein
VSTTPANPGDLKTLPGSSVSSSSGELSRQIVPTTQPSKQLSDLPKDELEHLAEDFGIDATRFKTPQLLVAAIHERRQAIAAMDREAMLDVVRWGRRPVSVNASKEHIAMEISRIRSMRFAGLSQRGLIVLATIRNARIRGDEPVPVLIRKLRKQEGFFARLNRKRRAFLGSLIAGMIGEDEQSDYQFLPPTQAGGLGASPSSSATIKHEIEESGLIGGIASRVKKSADSFLNQKLDEIEARIDRKLDEIDRRLAEWRDKEIANRIRILKITLWASVIVSLISLVYMYIQTYWWPSTIPPKSPPAQVAPQKS